MEPVLRVAILSRYALIRAGLLELVRAHPARAVVVDTAEQDGHLGDVDVVIYDLGSLAGPRASAHHRDLRHLLGKVPVVGLTRHDRDVLTHDLHALGVSQLVPEDVTADALLRALELAAGRDPRGRRACDRDVLSERERLVLCLIGAGLSNRQIAEQLWLSTNTVKTYIRSAYRKIEVTTRPQAVLWSARNQLIPGDESTDEPRDAPSALVEP